MNGTTPIDDCSSAFLQLLRAFPRGLVESQLGSTAQHLLLVLPGAWIVCTIACCMMGNCMTQGYYSTICLVRARRLQFRATFSGGRPALRIHRRRCLYRWERWQYLKLVQSLVVMAVALAAVALLVGMVEVARELTVAQTLA